MSTDAKRHWKCQGCRSAEPKTDNSNTPLGASRPAAAASAGSVGTAAAPTYTSTDSSNITMRQSKPRPIPFSPPDSNATINTSDDSIRRIVREEIQLAIRSSLNEHVTSHLKSINEKITSFEQSLLFINTCYEDMKKELEQKSLIIDQLKKSNEVLQQRFTKIENDFTTRLSNMEQHMRECNVEINGVPEHRTENLNITVEQIAKYVGCDVNKDDIVHVIRTSKLNKDNKDRPRTIVARLRTRSTRDGLLAAVFNYNKRSPKDKLSTHHLGISGDRQPVFVSEHLSPNNKSLHAATRIKAREVGYKFVWVRDGRIYTRKHESASALQIRNMDSLKLMT